MARKMEGKITHMVVEDLSSVNSWVELIERDSSGEFVNCRSLNMTKMIEKT